MANEQRKPDEQGTLTIFQNNQYVKVGTIELFHNQNPTDKQPVTYGKIRINKEYVGKFDVANVSAWSQKQREQMFGSNGAKQQ